MCSGWVSWSVVCYVQYMPYLLWVSMASKQLSISQFILSFSSHEVFLLYMSVVLCN